MTGQKILLDLPPEVLNRMSEYVLIKGKVHIKDVNSATPALLRTCRKLRYTYAPMFYGANIFVFDIVRKLCPKHYANDIVRDLFQQAKRWHSVTHPEHLDLIQHIQLGFPREFLPRDIRCRLWFDIHLHNKLLTTAANISLLYEDLQGTCTPVKIAALREHSKSTSLFSSLHSITWRLFLMRLRRFQEDLRNTCTGNEDLTSILDRFLFEPMHRDLRQGITPVSRVVAAKEQGFLLASRRCYFSRSSFEGQTYDSPLISDGSWFTHTAMTPSLRSLFACPARHLT